MQDFRSFIHYHFENEASGTRDSGSSTPIYALPRIANSSEAMVISIAVLDDYQGLAPTYFDKLDPSSFNVKYFPDTLRPYNHAETPETTKNALVKRLESFDVIGAHYSVLRTPYSHLDYRSCTWLKQTQPQ